SDQSSSRDWRKGRNLSQSMLQEFPHSGFNLRFHCLSSLLKRSLYGSRASSALAFSCPTGSQRRATLGLVPIHSSNQCQGLSLSANDELPSSFMVFEEW